MARSKIDFERAAMLMDVIQKVASVMPAYTALSSAASNELKEMQDVALKEQMELGRQRLKAEQEEAARLNEANEANAKIQAEYDAKDKAMTINPIKPINVKPGEPDELQAIKDHQASLELDQGEDHLGERRV